MTARERVQRVQRVLLLGAALSALLWAGLVALLVLAAGVLADQVFGLSLQLRSALPPLAAAAALTPLLLIAWRARRAREPGQVALWLEERVPELGYALVTALDPAGHAQLAALDSRVARVRFEPAAWRAARNAVLLPLLGAGAPLLLLALLPWGVVARIASPASDAARPGNPAEPGNALAGLVVRIEPPAYTGIAAETLDDPVRVLAVVGSRMRVEGRAIGDPVRASADSLSVPVTAGPERWGAVLQMPAAPVVLRLVQGTRERLLLLEPRLDSLPVVSLETPARDTVLRAARGTLPLAASFRDDFGLDQGWWELVISSGEGENFKFRTLLLGKAGFGGAREGRRTTALRLDSLSLEPGDLLHLRAVAQDGNTVTGPGVAGSDTRTIRIARSGEYDSLSIEAMPPTDPLKGLLSQRMLIMLTEALERKRPRLARAELLGESGRIARDQNALRRQVGDIIFSRLDDIGGEEHADDQSSRADMTPQQLLAAADSATQRAGDEALDFGGGESPVIAINRPLLEAYNAMWDAGRDLSVGETKKALPHMYAALAAIQRARLAERIYLRGRTKEAIVDLGRVRLVGKKDGIGPAARHPRTAEDAELARSAARFDAALERLGTERAAAVDSLLLLRAALLLTAPAAAAPLGDAIDALRSGRDATAPLVAARRALAGAPASHPGLPRFGTSP